MAHQESIKSNTIWLQDAEHLVPKITSLIFEGAHCDQKNKDIKFKLFRDSKDSNLGEIVHQLGIPSRYFVNKDVLVKKKSKSAFGGLPICVTHHHEYRRTVRLFIGGLSHCYNNLLMGIWGNASLIRMILNNNHPIQSCMEQIEALIQNGSNLIHLLFGYIVERRTAAKRLRLKQLIQEIKVYNKISGNEIDFAIIETSIIELSKIQNKVQLAACMAGVIDQMLTLVQNKRFLIEKEILDSPKAEDHLEKIDALLKRGFQMVRNLDYYAEAIAPR